MNEIRGEIHSIEAYALGKILDNSKWNLPRRITPSDFDLVFDNAGDVLACELSSSIGIWEDLSIGQRGAYARFVHNGVGRHVAAVCRHNVKPGEGRKIDSRNDITTFQLLIYRDGELFNSPIRTDWPAFVEDQFYSSRTAFTDWI